MSKRGYTMDKKRKVLFVSQNKTKLSFVSIDLAILKKTMMSELSISS